MITKIILIAVLICGGLLALLALIMFIVLVKDCYEVPQYTDIYDL